MSHILAIFKKITIDLPNNILYFSNMLKFWETCWIERFKLNISNNIGLVRCEPEWYWSPSQFIDFDLWIVLDGSGSIHINQTEYAVTTGFTICFPPGEWNVHAHHDVKQPLQVFYCHFKLETANGFNYLSDVPEPKPTSVQINPLLLGTLRELADPLNTNQSPMIQENLLWQILLRSEQTEQFSDSSPEERVRVLIREITENPVLIRNIDQLARQSSMSTGHFRRIFRRFTGYSPVQFILKRRIERAMYYLKTTHLTIQRIAAIVGYTDVYFFSRQFKEQTGLSPSAYRKQL